MARQIFRVDLSEEARDFQPTATEPGLAMLDRAGANFQIMHRWLGVYVAEPEWHGDLVNFYVNEPEGGRIEDVSVYPVSKKDLEGALKDDVEAIRTKLKKAVPESSTESLLLAIVRKTFATLMDDPDRSDFDCFFYKYRVAGGPWRLVWCWGYQRTDMQPCRPLLCQNPDCNIEFVRRPDTKNRCPRCQKVSEKKKPGVAGTLQRYAVPITVLLLVLLAALAWLGWPRLVVEPGDWTGPPGGRVAFTAKRTAFWLFEKDVSDEMIAQSDQPGVMEIVSGRIGRARTTGRANVRFQYAGYTAKSDILVTLDIPTPDSIAITPIIPEEFYEMGVGSTQLVRVMGEYSDRDPIDITEIATLKPADETIAFTHSPDTMGARIEGAGEGKTKITAAYHFDLEEDPLTASIEVTVKDVDYQKLETSVDPDVFAIGQRGQMMTVAFDADDNPYCVLGSSLLRVRTQSAINAEKNGDAKGDYVIGKVENDDFILGMTEGDDTLIAKLIKDEDATLTDNFDFTVGGSLLAGAFSVTPQRFEIFEGEEATIDVLSESILEITATSGDDNIAAAISYTDGSEPHVIGIAPGETAVTVTQGENTQTIDVVVKKARIASIEIRPASISLSPDETRDIRVIGRTDGGFEIDVAPSRLSWPQQPLADYVYFDREQLALAGMKRTPSPQDLVATFDGDPSLTARATVRVVGATDIDLAGDFGVHPPVPVGAGGLITGPGGAGAYFGERGLAPDVLPEEWRSYLHDDEYIIGDDRGYYRGLPRGVIEERLGRLGPGGRVLVGGPGGERYVDLPLTLEDTLAKMGAIVTSSKISPSGDSAQIAVRVSKTGEYRIVDSSGAALSDTKSIPADGSATFDLSGVPAGQEELNIERTIGGQTKLIPFTLQGSN